MNNKRTILHGCKEIMEYIGISSIPRFKKYIKAGMPARLEDNRWVAHIDNLNEYFRKRTRYIEKNPPDSAE